MNRIIAVILVFLLMGALGYVAITNQGNKSQVRSFETVKTDLNSGAQLIDVRTPEEYAGGHFENAILHSLQDIESGKMPDVAKDTKIYVYCRSGNRSSQAKVLLEKAGYTNIIDLGGLEDVKKLGAKLSS